MSLEYSHHKTLPKKRSACIPPLVLCSPPCRGEIDADQYRRGIDELQTTSDRLHRFLKASHLRASVELLAMKCTSPASAGPVPAEPKLAEMKLPRTYCLLL
ncbi:hypothetical protein BgiMline_029132 [Biomphalaria glabrata]